MDHFFGRVPVGLGRRSATGAVGGRRRRGARAGEVAIEFAILSVALFTFLLFLFEIAYDLYTQEALDAGLHAAVRAIQTGRAQNVLNGSDFVNRFMCPSLRGLLECGSHIYVKVQKLTLSGSQDYFTVPNGANGKVPVSGNTINLAGYGSTNFCNSAPGQVTLVSAIYLGPTFVGGLLPGIFSVYGPSGMPVHATLSTTGLVTEDYTQTAPPQGVVPAAGC